MGYIPTRDLLRLYAKTCNFSAVGGKVHLSPQAVKQRIDLHLDPIFGKDWRQRLIREKILAYLEEEDGEKSN